METRSYKNISDNEEAKFFDMAGFADYNQKLFGALEFDIESKWQYRASDIRTPTLKLHKQIGLSDYGTYSSKVSETDKFYNFTEALQAYNAHLEENNASRYKINNIPDNSPNMRMDHIKKGGIGYSSENLKSCVVLSQSVKEASNEHMAALIYCDGCFATVDNIPIGENGKIDLSKMYCPKLECKDMQQALDEYIGITKQPIIENSVKQEVETLGCQDFLAKLAEVATKSAEQQNLNSAYALVLGMHGKEVADDVIQVSMQEVSMGNYAKFNGRGHDQLKNMEVGEDSIYQFSFSELKTALKDVGIDRVWNHSGDLDMDFTMDQLDKLKEAHLPKKEQTVEYSAQSIGKSLEQDPELTGNELIRTIRDFNKSQMEKTNDVTNDKESIGE